jgi:hypothetical protein
LIRQRGWRLRNAKRAVWNGCIGDASCPSRLTGDPAKVGDDPGAASVYDVNSVELISIIKRLNETTVELAEFARGV